MSAGGQGAAAAGVAPAGLQVRQEPLFHSVPPRPQRLLHSEAYIKYIEVSCAIHLIYALHYDVITIEMQGLNKDSRSMCNWDKQLNATQEV